MSVDMSEEKEKFGFTFKLDLEGVGSDVEGVWSPSVALKRSLDVGARHRSMVSLWVLV